MTSTPEKAPSTKKLARTVGGSAAARIIVLPISAILGIFTTRLIIDNFGQSSYAQYMLLVGISSLIPFADLGISASIMNATAAAEDPRTDSALFRTLVTCMRVLAGSASVLTVVAIVLTVAGAWPTLLGEGLSSASGNLAAGLCLVALASAMLVGFGQRILIGLGLNFLTILVGGLQTPIVLLVVFVCAQSGWNAGPYVAVASYLSLLLTGGICLMLANRRIRPTIGKAFRAAFKVRTVKGGRILNTAWPMMVQMIALPLAMQTDRLVLSHADGVGELSKYALASQMFNPIFSVSVAASMALWPVFAKARSTGSTETSPRQLSLVFGGFALMAVTVMALASGFLADVASNGTIGLPVELVLAFSVLMVVQAAKSPLGMYMTDAKGLRFQAFSILLMVPVNLGLSILLAERWGAVGPVIGSIIGVSLFQLVANWLYVTRAEKQAKIRAAQPGVSPDAGLE